MTLDEIKDRVMFQTNNDSEDVGDYMPHLVDYINDGYDRLVNAWAKTHCGTEDWPWLQEAPEPDTPETDVTVEVTEEATEEVIEEETEPWTLDIPKTPEWTHKYLADWATWLVYRNGNPQKQQRGIPFRNAFEEILSQIRGEGGADGMNEDGTRKLYKFFRNIPR